MFSFQNTFEVIKKLPFEKRILKNKQKREKLKIPKKKKKKGVHFNISPLKYFASVKLDTFTFFFTKYP
jgi:hypothetical protein